MCSRAFGLPRSRSGAVSPRAFRPRVDRCSSHGVPPIPDPLRRHSVQSQRTAHWWGMGPRREEGASGLTRGMQATLTSNSRHVAAKAARAVSKASARLAERDHEVRVALFAIEVAASGVARHRDQMTSRQVEELLDGLCAETRRLRALLSGGDDPLTTFDLGAAIAPV